MVYNKETNKEIARINEIIIRNSGDLLMEQPAEAKLVREVVEGFVTPKGLNTFFGSLGLTVLDYSAKFVSNFDDIQKLLKIDGGWDKMVGDATEVFRRTEWSDLNGVIKTAKEVDELGDEALDQAIKNGEIIETITYFEKTIKGFKEIDKVDYDRILKASDDYHSLPPYLRYTKKEIELMLEGVTSGGIKTLDDYVVALQRFLKGGDLTDDLRKAIVATMGNIPGFTKGLKDVFMKNKKFANHATYLRMTNKMSELGNVLSEVLGLDKKHKIIDDLSHYFSKEGSYVEEYFEFLGKSWVPFHAIKKLRPVMWHKVDNWYKLVFGDIIMGGIYDYIMGAQVLKSLFKSGSNFLELLSGKDNVKKVIVRVVLFITAVGGYRSAKDWDIASMDPRTLLDKFMGIFGTCVGDDRVNDALTGRLFRNVVGKKEVTDKDDRKVFEKCPNLEFSAGFLAKFEDDTETVKTNAEAMYAALNIDSHDDHALLRMNFLPSVSKMFFEFTSMWKTDSDIAKALIEQEGMDILSLSQISDYYEEKFSSSFLEDAQNLDQWSGLFGGMNFDAFSTAINKLPYLNPKTIGEANFDTFEEMVTESAKHIWIYPDGATYEYEDDGDTFENTIELSKCGTGCADGGSPCNCNTGGCKISGQPISADMVIALKAEGVTDQLALNTLCSTGEGYDKLKKIFDETMQVASIGCKLRPRPTH